MEKLLRSKGLRINAKMRKMVISNENVTEKLTEEGNLLMLSA